MLHVTDRPATPLLVPRPALTSIAPSSMAAKKSLFTSPRVVSFSGAVITTMSCPPISPGSSLAAWTSSRAVLATSVDVAPNAASSRAVAVPVLPAPTMRTRLPARVSASTLRCAHVLASWYRTSAGHCRSCVRIAASAIKDAKLPSDVHFHDLRHTGNHLAATNGASTKELMARMGHSTMRAALIYQHATRERDHAIADAISRNVETERESNDDTAA